MATYENRFSSFVRSFALAWLFVLRLALRKMTNTHSPADEDAFTKTVNFSARKRRNVCTQIDNFREELLFALLQCAISPFVQYFPSDGCQILTRREKKKEMVKRRKKYTIQIKYAVQNDKRIRRIMGKMVAAAALTHSLTHSAQHMLPYAIIRAKQLLIQQS